jgi:YVTN family beta-propeller protein
VKVGSKPYALAENPVNGRVYTANSNSDNVSVIDEDSHKVIATVTVGGEPEAVAVNPVNGRVYVANEASKSVSVIDGASNKVTATVMVGNEPGAVAVNPVSGRVYVANLADNTVSVIDGASNTVTATVNVGSIPVALAVNPLNGQVYVANFGSGTASVIDGPTNKVIATLNVGESPDALAVNPLDGRVFIVSAGGRQVGVISVGSNTVNFGVYVGDSADYTTSLVVNPLSGRVYVANYYDGTVSVLNDDNYSVNVIASLNVENPYALAVNPVNGKIFVANPGGNAVVEIDRVAQAVPITIGTQGSTSVPSPYTWLPATADSPYATTDPNPSFSVTVTSQYTQDTAYQGVLPFIPVNPLPTALYYWVDDGSTSSWSYAAPVAPSKSNPATFSVSLSNKAPGFHILYLFAAYGNEGTPAISSTGMGNSPEISNIAGYPFYISPVPTGTAVQTDANPQNTGSPVTFTATVTPAAAGAVATLTGTVNFYDGATLLNPTPVSLEQLPGSYQATYQTSNLTAGTHKIQAIYSGDTNYDRSSGSLSEKIAGQPN